MILSLPQKVIESITKKIWLFNHQFDHYQKILLLDHSGKILGYNGANETSWLEEDGTLYFLGPTGQKSICFAQAVRRLGRLVLEGEFLDPNLNGAKVQLEEASGVQHLLPVSIEELASHREVLKPSTDVRYPPHMFGDLSMDGDSYPAPAVQRMQLNDARVISRFGAVRVGSRFVESTAFQHPFFLTHNLIEDRGAGYLHASAGDVVSIDRAFYVCGGVYDNYYHWLLFLIARLHPDFFFGIDTIITSQPTTEFQRTGLEVLLKKYDLKAVYIRDNVSLHVGELTFAQQFGTAGLDPHPVFMETFRDLKAALVSSASPASELIYISRSDASERKLVNEHEVETLVAEHGFQVVSLQGRSLNEQAALLHGARVVISPHGAGMTNIVFCQPNAKILEFQNPAHINWCMKRLAAINSLDYGFLMGSLVEEGRKEYRINIFRLRELLNEMDL